ncbi:MAG: TRAP transporter TatT component family protein [Elusimicrobiota bacterium]|nr:TRAP transporter TatT component family protein [Elusimicrobiota bacterium]
MKKFKLSIFNFLAFALLTGGFSGCSLNKIAVNKTAQLIDKGLPSFYREKNTKLAKQALPANLKLMEVLLETTPKNVPLLRNLSQGYCGYSFMFEEDEDKRLASELYLKGMDFAFKALKSKRLAKGLKIDDSKIKAKDVPEVFWYVFCKTSWINLNRDNPDAIAELPSIIPLAKKIEEFDPSYYYNGIYSVLGAYHVIRPRMFGGNPKKSKEYFTKALTGEGRQFLLNKLIYAKLYAVTLMEEELFDKLIEEILNAPENNLPETNLANGVAKEKAVKLKEKRNELF